MSTMGRPQSVSDEEILGAARLVISRSGYDRFTLSEVADEIGLSRAAIILRFQSTQGLKARLLTEGVQKFLKRLATLPHRSGGDGLLDLADFIGNTKGPDSISHFFTILRGTLDDPKAAALEKLRSQAWHMAIVDRMPPSAIGRDDAAYLFSAMLVGAIIQWETSPVISCTQFLRQRTQDWLTMARIEFTARNIAGHRLVRTTAPQPLNLGEVS
jgi:TetR/AcrR family macrolide resistance operon transcriptional repressor